MNTSSHVGTADEVLGVAATSPPAGATKDELRDLLSGEGFDGVNPTLMLGRAVGAGRVLVPDFLRFPPGNRMMVPVPAANLVGLCTRSRIQLTRCACKAPGLVSQPLERG